MYNINQVLLRMKRVQHVNYIKMNEKFETKQSYKTLDETPK
jgi:hypothetical protein